MGNVTLCGESTLPVRPVGTSLPLEISGGYADWIGGDVGSSQCLGTSHVRCGGRCSVKVLPKIGERGRRGRG